MAVRCRPMMNHETSRNDANVIKAVNEITNCKSKVILCGVGKSGLIASKISATLSSVGCPSFSISANDCLHGDLGSISVSAAAVVYLPRRVQICSRPERSDFIQSQLKA